MAITTQINSGTPTAYAPLVAGTTASGPIQYASTGIATSGFILTSNGSSAVPSFQALPAGMSVTSITLNQSQLQGMYATPVQVLAAAGAHTVIAVSQVIAEYFYAGTPAFSGGGAGILQYSNTVHGGGTSITALSGISILTGANSNFYVVYPTLALNSTATVTPIVNQGIYVSNQTAAFTSGNASSTFKVTLFYYVVTTTN